MLTAHYSPLTAHKIAILTERTVLEELEGAPRNQFDGTLRAHPERWTAEAWRLAYGFAKGDVKVVERNDF